MAKSFPFIDCMMDCNLVDMGYTGSNYTWCNGRSSEDRIWKRLDRVIFKGLDTLNSWTFGLNKVTFLILSSKHGTFRNCIGDIFGNTKKLEKKVEDLEIAMENNVSSSTRQEYNKANAELIKHLKIQDSYRRQKARLKWFNEGDRNTKFVHSVINIKRRRLSLKAIKDDDGNWIEGEDQIASEAIKFFQNQFTQEDYQPD
ncbi:uncharacterized protein LOC132601793 [Lycium barbarum]|uniref:uncharacterized protein LOC132601793 n=1 Tax=Lycium barbarum TaxID=112863 RepID=UPI00293F162A|nr:uncharacterized protein LOC132601793 [Lycium barbarum]